MTHALQLLSTLAQALKKRVPTVADVRADKQIGIGSSSYYQEHYSDDDLQREINRLVAAGVPDVLQHLRRTDMLAADQQNRAFLQLAGVI